jgi:hypothetical protein
MASALHEDVSLICEIHSPLLHGFNDMELRMTPCGALFALCKDILHLNIIP